MEYFFSTLLKRFKKLFISLILSSFLSQQLVFAAGVSPLELGPTLASHLQQIGFSSSLTSFNPPILRFLNVNRDNPYNYFNFLLDKGDSHLTTSNLNKEAEKLISYFKIGIALPNETFWVNLKPNEKENILPAELEQTDLGKVLLEADLRLKKDAARFLHPEHPQGKIFWSRLFQELGSNTQVTTQNRLWIVPDKAQVWQTEDGVLVVESSLKVLLENEYLKKTPQDKTQALAENLMKEIILPELTKEINTIQAYAPLRQVYNALILAQWFKQQYQGKSAPLAANIDRGLTEDLISNKPWSKEEIWQQYVKSLKQGEYKANILQGQVQIQYFSGGIQLFGIVPEPIPFEKAVTSPIVENNLKSTRGGVAFVEYGPDRINTSLPLQRPETLGGLWDKTKSVSSPLGAPQKPAASSPLAAQQKLTTKAFTRIATGFILILGMPFFLNCTAINTKKAVEFAKNNPEAFEIVKESIVDGVTHTTLHEISPEIEVYLGLQGQGVHVVTADDYVMSVFSGSKRVTVAAALVFKPEKDLPAPIFKEIADNVFGAQDYALIIPGNTDLTNPIHKAILIHEGTHYLDYKADPKAFKKQYRRENLTGALIGPAAAMFDYRHSKIEEKAFVAQFRYLQQQGYTFEQFKSETENLFNSKIEGKYLDFLEDKWQKAEGSSSPVQIDNKTAAAPQKPGASSPIGLDGKDLALKGGRIGDAELIQDISIPLSELLAAPTTPKESETMLHLRSDWGKEYSEDTLKLVAKIESIILTTTGNLLRDGYLKDRAAESSLSSYLCNFSANALDAITKRHRSDLKKGKISIRVYIKENTLWVQELDNGTGLSVFRLWLAKIFGIDIPTTKKIRKILGGYTYIGETGTAIRWIRSDSKSAGWSFSMENRSDMRGAVVSIGIPLRPSASSPVAAPQKPTASSPLEASVNLNPQIKADLEEISSNPSNDSAEKIAWLQVVLKKYKDFWISASEIQNLSLLLNRLFSERIEVMPSFGGEKNRYVAVRISDSGETFAGSFSIEDWIKESLPEIAKKYTPEELEPLIYKIFKEWQTRYYFSQSSDEARVNATNAFQRLITDKYKIKLINSEWSSAEEIETVTYLLLLLPQSMLNSEHTQWALRGGIDLSADRIGGTLIGHYDDEKGKLGIQRTILSRREFIQAFLHELGHAIGQEYINTEKFEVLFLAVEKDLYALPALGYSADIRKTHIMRFNDEFFAETFMHYILNGDLFSHGFIVPGIDCGVKDPLPWEEVYRYFRNVVFDGTVYTTAQENVSSPLAAPQKPGALSSVESREEGTLLKNSFLKKMQELSGDKSMSNDLIQASAAELLKDTADYVDVAALHGTQSGTLVDFAKLNGRLLPSGQMESVGVVPFVGEPGLNATAEGINMVAVSFAGFSSMRYALKYSRYSNKNKQGWSAEAAEKRILELESDLRRPNQPELMNDLAKRLIELYTKRIARWSQLSPEDKELVGLNFPIVFALRDTHKYNRVPVRSSIPGEIALEGEIEPEIIYVPREHIEKIQNYLKGKVSNQIKVLPLEPLIFLSEFNESFKEYFLTKFKDNQAYRQAFLQALEEFTATASSPQAAGENQATSSPISSGDERQATDYLAKSQKHFVKFRLLNEIQDFLNKTGTDFNIVDFISNKVNSGLSIAIGDVGCGFGVMLNQLKDDFGDRLEAYGVDLVDWHGDPNYLRIARDELRTIYGIYRWKIRGPEAAETYNKLLSEKKFIFMQQDIGKVIFPKKMDLLTSFFTLQYHNNPLSVWCHLFNQLSPGGVLITQLVIPFGEEGTADFYKNFADNLRKSNIEIELKDFADKNWGRHHIILMAKRQGSEEIKLEASTADVSKKRMLGSRGSVEILFVKYKEVKVEVSKGGAHNARFIITSSPLGALMVHKIIGKIGLTIEDVETPEKRKLAADKIYNARTAFTKEERRVLLSFLWSENEIALVYTIPDTLVAKIADVMDKVGVDDFRTFCLGGFPIGLIRSLQEDAKLQPYEQTFIRKVLNANHPQANRKNNPPSGKFIPNSSSPLQEKGGIDGSAREKIPNRKTTGHTFTNRLELLHNKIIEFLNKQGLIKDSIVVVDLGIGEGGGGVVTEQFALRLRKEFQKVTVIGVDNNREYVEKANNRIKDTPLPEGINLYFVNGGFDLSILKVEGAPLNNVDVVLVSNVLDHYFVEERPMAKGLMLKAINDKGILVVSSGPGNKHMATAFAIYSKTGEVVESGSLLRPGVSPLMNLRPEIIENEKEEPELKPGGSSSPLQKEKDVAGIDFTSIEIKKLDLGKDAPQNPVDRKIYFAQAMFKQGWDALAVLYLKQAISLLKHNVASDYQQKDLLMKLLAVLQQKEQLDEESINFFESAKNNQVLIKA